MCNKTGLITGLSLVAGFFLSASIIITVLSVHSIIDLKDYIHIEGRVVGYVGEWESCTECAGSTNDFNCWNVPATGYILVNYTVKETTYQSRPFSFCGETPSAAINNTRKRINIGSSFGGYYNKEDPGAGLNFVGFSMYILIVPAILFVGFVAVLIFMWRCVLRKDPVESDPLLDEKFDPNYV